MSRRRQRRRASDIADVRPKRGLGAAFLLCIGLALVVLYKAGVGEETAGFIAQVTGDPALELPESVLDRMDTAAPAPPFDAGPGRTPPDTAIAAPAADGGPDADAAARTAPDAAD